MRRWVLPILIYYACYNYIFNNGYFGGADENSGWKLQRRTMANMRTIEACLEAYRLDNDSHPPLCLEDLAEVFPHLKNCLNDGWGRIIHYYPCDRHWVLISHGEDDKPDTVCIEGALSPEYEYAWDIVMIDKEFVRSPVGTPRT